MWPEKMTEEQMIRAQMIWDALDMFGYKNGYDDILILTDKEVSKRYHKLARKYHPDKNGNSKESEAKFHEITIALGVLVSLLEAGDREVAVEKLKRFKAEEDEENTNRLINELKREKLFWIADVAKLWNEQLTLKYLSDMRRDDIMELLKELNDDKVFKHGIQVIDRNDFANIIATWNKSKYDITSTLINDDDDYKQIGYGATDNVMDTGNDLQTVDQEEM